LHKAGAADVIAACEFARRRHQKKRAETTLCSDNRTLHLRLETIAYRDGRGLRAALSSQSVSSQDLDRVAKCREFLFAPQPTAKRYPIRWDLSPVV